MATTKLRPIAPAARPRRALRRAGARPGHGAQDQPDDKAGHQPAGEQCRDRDPGDGADGDQDQAGRDRFGLRARRRQQRHQVAASGTACLHLREQHRGHRRHVGGLRPGYARNQVHRADQHERQAAAHVAQQVRQEAHHDARHAGHLDQQTKEDEQRHRQQHRVRHAGVHPCNQHRERHVRRQRQVAERGEAEGDGDGNAEEHRHRDHAEEEDQQIEPPERQQHRMQQPEPGEHRADQCKREDRLPHRAAIEAQQRGDDHQTHPDRHRRGAPGHRQIERHDRHDRFISNVVDRGQQDGKQEGQRRGQCKVAHEAAGRGTGAVDQRGHAHVLVAAQRQHGAEHRQPQEQQ